MFENRFKLYQSGFFKDQRLRYFGELVLCVRSHIVNSIVASQKESASTFWFRSTMDSISDSDSEDAGSIPAGATTEQSKEIKPLNSKGWAVFVFVTYPFYSSIVKCVVRDSGELRN